MAVSAREGQVAALIALGLSNREIGEVLIVSVQTVEAHVTHILNKLGLRYRTQVAVWAAERGVGPLNIRASRRAAKGFIHTVGGFASSERRKTRSQFI